MAGAGLIEAYLEQLRSELPRRSDTDDVIAEVDDHLHSIVEAHLSLGLTEDAATRHALGAFGSADLVARAFAQQQGDTVAMPTTFTTYAGVAAIVGGTILGITLALASVTSLDVGSNSAWFGPTALAGAVLAMIGLLGIDARHRALYGNAGRVARLLIPVGMVLLIASIVTWFAPGYLVSMAAILIGVVALGMEVWRGGVLPRGAVALVGLGIAGIPPASLLQNDATATWTAGTVAGMVVFAVMGAGLVWLGYGLWSEKGSLDVNGGGSPTATV